MRIQAIGSQLDEPDEPDEPFLRVYGIKKIFF